jgi:hypothetical protein
MFTEEGFSPMPRRLGVPLIVVLLLGVLSLGRSPFGLLGPIAAAEGAPTRACQPGGCLDPGAAPNPPQGNLNDLLAFPALLDATVSPNCRLPDPSSIFHLPDGSYSTHCYSRCTLEFYAASNREKQLEGTPPLTFICPAPDLLCAEHICLPGEPIPGITESVDTSAPPQRTLADCPRSEANESSLTSSCAEEVLRQAAIETIQGDPSIPFGLGAALVAALTDPGGANADPLQGGALAQDPSALAGGTTGSGAQTAGAAESRTSSSGSSSTSLSNEAGSGDTGHHPLPPRIRIEGNQTFQDQVTHCFDLYYATPGPVGHLLSMLESRDPDKGAPFPAKLVFIRFTSGSPYAHDLSEAALDGYMRVSVDDPFAGIRAGVWSNGPGASAAININSSPLTFADSDLLTDEITARPLTPEERASALGQYPAGAGEQHDVLASGFCIWLIHELAHATDIVYGQDDPRPFVGDVPIPNPYYQPRPGDTPQNAPERFVIRDEKWASGFENAYRFYHPPYTIRTSYDGLLLPPDAADPVVLGLFSP